MDVHPWQILVGTALLLIVYAVSAVLLDAPVSAGGFLAMVFFLAIGAVIGRFLSGYFF